jgi:FkbM family methyltransferase
MNDLAKTTVKRLLSSAGIRILREDTYRDTYSRNNYPAAKAAEKPVIFDVGANIGQSSIWYSKNFPNASIHAFEPVPSVFKSLQRNTVKIPQIHPHQLGAGKASTIISIPEVESSTIQTTQVLRSVKSTGGNLIDVKIVDLDSFAAEQNISVIHILKTDTEGFDLDVLEGARRMLETQSIRHIVSEATLHARDEQHTNLFEMIDLLSAFGYRLAAFYDLGHLPNGETSFFNASFLPSN